MEAKEYRRKDGRKKNADGVTGDPKQAYLLLRKRAAQQTVDFLVAISGPRFVPVNANAKEFQAQDAEHAQRCDRPNRYGRLCRIERNRDIDLHDIQQHQDSNEHSRDCASWRSKPLQGASDLALGLHPQQLPKGPREMNSK